MHRSSTPERCADRVGRPLPGEAGGRSDRKQFTKHLSGHTPGCAVGDGEHRGPRPACGHRAPANHPLRPLRPQGRQGGHRRGRPLWSPDDRRCRQPDHRRSSTPVSTSSSTCRGPARSTTCADFSHPESTSSPPEASSTTRRAWTPTSALESKRPARSATPPPQHREQSRIHHRGTAVGTDVHSASTRPPRDRRVRRPVATGFTGSAVRRDGIRRRPGRGRATSDRPPASQHRPLAATPRGRTRPTPRRRRRVRRPFHRMPRHHRCNR